MTRTINDSPHLTAKIASLRRKENAIDSIVKALPSGLTPEEMHEVASQFLGLVERHHPRR